MMGFRASIDATAEAEEGRPRGVVKPRDASAADIPRNDNRGRCLLN